MPVVGLPISNLIKVSVSLSAAAAPAQNLSTLLILGTSDVIPLNERVRLYSSIEGVANDFGDVAPEYLAAVLWYEQSPQPTDLMIGRWANVAAAGQLLGAPLTAEEQDIANFTAVSDGGFSVSVDGTATEVTGLDFATVTNLNAVASAINAVAPTLTCVWNASTEQFIFTSKTTGPTSMVGYLTPPTGGATDVSSLLGGALTDTGSVAVPGQAAESALTAVQVCDEQFGQQWYAVTVLGSQDTDSIAIAPYIEAANNFHFFGVTTQEPTCLEPSDTTNIAYELMEGEYNRSAVQYSSTSPYAVVSLLARILTTDWAGNATTITLMYKQEPGITPETLSNTQQQALEGFNCNVFAAYNNNTAIIQYGTCASGQFIDTVIGASAFAVDEMTAIYNLLYTSLTKIPQTDPGMNQIGTTIENVAAQYVANGYIGPGVWTGPLFGVLQLGSDGSLPYLSKGYYLYTPPIANQAQAQRAARISVPFQLAAKLQGAVHTVDLAMTINP